MKIPKSFNINGCTWRVEFNEKECANQKSDACCKLVEHKIFLRKFYNGGAKIHDDEIVDNFFHELLHAIINPIEGSNLKFDNDENSELIIKVLAPRLAEAIRSFKY